MELSRAVPTLWAVYSGRRQAGFRRRVMILKAFSASLVGMLVLASAGVSQADVYRPGEFLGLDLNRAAFSAKLLGPPCASTISG